MLRPSDRCPFGVFALADASAVRPCSRPSPYLDTESGFSSTRTEGRELPPTTTCPTPVTCASFCAITVDAASYIAAFLYVSDVSASMKIGESAGFTLRYVGLPGRFAGRY